MVKDRPMSLQPTEKQFDVIKQILESYYGVSITDKYHDTYLKSLPDGEKPRVSFKSFVSSQFFEMMSDGNIERVSNAIALGRKRNKEIYQNFYELEGYYPDWDVDV